MAHPLGHFKTITKHRHKVIRNCFKAGIFWQGLRHDLSKYSPTEFIPGAKFYLGTRSPNEKEREVYGYSMAWMHHKGRNKHHWEYWYDLKDGIWQPLKMPFPYFVEMVCDRVAACRIYQKDAYTFSSALVYFNTRNDRLYMHSENAEQLKLVLEEIAEKGEKPVFEKLRQQLKEYRKNNNRQKVKTD